MKMGICKLVDWDGFGTTIIIRLVVPESSFMAQMNVVLVCVDYADPTAELVASPSSSRRAFVAALALAGLQ